MLNALFNRSAFFSFFIVFILYTLSRLTNEQRVLSMSNNQTIFMQFTQMKCRASTSLLSHPVDRLLLVYHIMCNVISVTQIQQGATKFCKTECSRHRRVRTQEKTGRTDVYQFILIIIFFYVFNFGRKKHTHVCTRTFLDLKKKKRK